jgi:hypothetical protein
MRYTLGIFHLAINPTGFNQSQWEIKKQRSQIVQKCGATASHPQGAMMVV